jgi:hypothetical protein
MRRLDPWSDDGMEFEADPESGTIRGNAIATEGQEIHSEIATEAKDKSQRMAER